MSSTSTASKCNQAQASIQTMKHQECSTSAAFAAWCSCCMGACQTQAQAMEATVGELMHINVNQIKATKGGQKLLHKYTSTTRTGKGSNS
eukprot:258860-Pelagomonas_calceolata.AAC.3